MELVQSDNNVYQTPIIGFNDYMFQHSVLIGRIWDEEIIDAILPYLSGDTDFLDIGANIGLLTLGLLHKAKQQRIDIHQIHCFECSPQTFPLLQKNMEPFPCVKLYAFAVGDHQQLCNMTENKYNKGCDYISFTTDSYGEKEYDYTPIRYVGSEERLVPQTYVLAVPLDSIMYQFKKRISVLKIDVEGFELHALKGAVRLIGLHRPVIVVEIWAIYIEPIVSLLKGLGYHTYRHVKNPHYHNEDYIFYPDELHVKL
jgi:FkbM family methyltransferase